LGVTAVLFFGAPAHAMKLCREHLQHVDIAAVFQQQQRWTSVTEMKHTVERLRQICQERHGENCENYGVFGPGSMMWEVSRVPFLALFAETELYLQLAHPVGAQGVWDHSPRLMEDPIRRFQSTFNHLWNMTYGNLEDSMRIARIIHLQHTKVVGILDDSAGNYNAGEIYSATDVDALHWVHATHMLSLLRLYETLERRLTADEEDRFFADAKLFGMMLGVPEELLPNTASEFYRYFYGKLQSGELQYNSAARRIESHFRTMARSQEADHAVLALARRYSDLITAINLPQQYAEAWGLHRPRRRGRLAYGATLAGLRAAYRAMPRLFSELPLYRMAMARAQGQAPSPTDQRLQRLLTGEK
jgi:uncharacterized protein (DUF2236 family)